MQCIEKQALASFCIAVPCPSGTISQPRRRCLRLGSDMHPPSGLDWCRQLCPASAASESASKAAATESEVLCADSLASTQQGVGSSAVARADLCKPILDFNIEGSYVRSAVQCPFSLASMGAGIAAARVRSAVQCPFSLASMGAGIAAAPSPMGQSLKALMHSWVEGLLVNIEGSCVLSAVQCPLQLGLDGCMHCCSSASKSALKA